MTTADTSMVYDFDTGRDERADGPPEPIPASRVQRDEPDNEYVDAAQDPEHANAAASLAAQDDSDQPLLAKAPSGLVSLPGGVLLEEEYIQDCEVREMTGADEEAVSKPLQAGNLVRFVDMLLRSCTVRIGNHEGKPVERMLDTMLVGDRDMLVMAIRQATYGDSIRLDVTCPFEGCGADFQVDYKLSVDVPVKKLEDCPDVTDATKRRYDLPLPSGKVAIVKLIDGSAQKAVYTPDTVKKTTAELNTLLLRECVLEIDGRPVRGLGPVREDLSANDRKTLLKFLVENQPGPQYGEVTQECIECQEKFPLVLNVLTMFR